VASDSFSDDLVCGPGQYNVVVSGSCGDVEVQGHADTPATLRVTGTDANGDPIDVTQQVEGDFSLSDTRIDPGTYGPHSVTVQAQLLVGGSPVASHSFSDDLVCGPGQYTVVVSGSCGDVEVQGHADTPATLRVTGTDANGDPIDVTQSVEGDFSFSYSCTDPGTYGPHTINIEAKLLVDASPVASDSFNDDLICGEPEASACYSAEVPETKLPKEGAELTVCAIGAGGSARLMNLTDDVPLGGHIAVQADGRACFTRHFYPEVKYQVQYKGETGQWSTSGCAFSFGKKIHKRGDLYLRKSVVAPCGAVAAMVEHYAESEDWKLTQVAAAYHILDLRTVDSLPFDRSCQTYGGPAAEVEVWGAGFKAHLTSPDGQAVYLSEYFSADGYDGVAGAPVWDENVGQVFGVLAGEFPPLTVDGYAIQSPFDWLAQTYGLTWTGEVIEGKAMAEHLGLVCPRVQRGAGVYCGWIRNYAEQAGPPVTPPADPPQPLQSYGHALGAEAPVVNSLTIEGHETRNVVQLAQWDHLPTTNHFGLSPDGSVIGGHLDDQSGHTDVGSWIAGMEIGDRAGLGADSYVAVKKFSVRQTGNLKSDLQSISDGLGDGQRALVTCHGQWQGQLYSSLAVVVLSPADSAP
jgi:hypothetical protein